MENTNERKFNLKMILTVLFWGGLWGIVEATLGTILHLPGIDDLGIFTASTVIIIPIAYCLMANCYKKTQTFYSVYLMGVLAALIKLSVAFVVGFTIKVYDPAIFIVMEALAMGTALAIFKPTTVVSLKTFASVVFANTIYQLSFLLFQQVINGNQAFSSVEAWESYGQKYLLTMNGLAIIYTLAVGAIAYGLFKLAHKYNWKINLNLDKIMYSPITASVAVLLAVGLSIGLAFVK